MRRSPLIPALLLTLAACAAIYFPLLGRTGLSQTEGHRVAPAWSMLESGDWLIPRMFGQAYLRKPPGMPWAIAAGTALFGHNEFAARLPSALAITALALFNALFAHRWFGPGYPGRTLLGSPVPGGAGPPPFPGVFGSTLASPALWAGLATALTPLFWRSGRSAEIEALNTLAAGAAVLCLIDLLLRPAADRRRSSLAVALGAGAALTAGALLKGPAALPAVAGAVLAACLLQRSARPLARPALWLALAIAADVAALVYWRVRSALAATGETPILQSPTEFLWGSTASILEIVRMPPAALFSALPASLALVFLFSRSADAEAAGGPMPAAASDRARALAITTMVALALLLLLGVPNPRYAMPALGFLPVLAGWLAHRATASRTSSAASRAWNPHLRRAVPLATLALFAAAGLYILKIEPRQRAGSGREAGLRLAGAIARATLPDRAAIPELWSDHLIEARPEVLLYAERELSRAAALADAGARPRVLFRWTPGLSTSPRLPPPGHFLLLRTDADSGESAAYERAGLIPRLEPLAEDAVHKYAFTLYRIR
ncbi:MAG: glycosyltransferase family 39 protein [Phycisphaerales bacterium]